jgi:replicative DNA helicase
MRASRTSDAYGAFYSRVGIALAWTRTNLGTGAKACRESGSGSWKQARPLSPDPSAAAGFFTRKLATRNPVIPARANKLVLFDFDGAPLEKLVAQYGLALPGDAWRVPTARGTHIYAAAPSGHPGLKVELTPERTTVITDGYLLAPPGRHPSGPEYAFENVDVETEDKRPPALDEALLERLQELAGGGRERIATLLDSGDPIDPGDRHAALMHRAAHLRGEGLGAKAIRAALEELQDRFTEPTGRRGEIGGIVRWVMDKPAPPPLDPVDVELLRALDELPEVSPPATRSEEQPREAPPGDESWEQPVPLTGRMQPPAFPIDALPGWLRSWAIELAREKQASIDLAAVLGLGVVAGAIARHVHVSPRAGWWEPVNLYLAIALEPGQRKTPIFKAAFRPVRALERARMQSWDEQNELVVLSEAILDKRRKGLIAEAADDDELDAEQLRQRMGELVDGLGETEAVPRPRLLTEDVTPEGLAALLAEHGRIIAASDEGAAIFENLAGRYAHGSTSWDIFNKAHSAADLVVDRKSSGPVIVWDPALTLVIATQPKVLRDLWGKPGAEGRGVLARPLYTFPDPAYDVGRTAPAPASALSAFEASVCALFDDVPLLALDEDGKPQPVTLRLAEDAEPVFERYEDELGRERRELGTSDEAEDEAAYLGWLSKLAGQTARLAACLHVAVHWTSGACTNVVIGRREVEDAITLARYFHVNARAVFGLMGELPEQRRASSILRWLRDRDGDELARLTVRDIHRTRGKRTRAGDLRPALAVLEQHGYVRLERRSRPGPGRPPSERVHVHPEIQNSRSQPDKPDRTRIVSGLSGQSREFRFCEQHPDVGAWKARDGVWRCRECEPPTFAGEVLEERS